MGSLRLRAAIIGAGPSGFYTADALLKSADPPFAVDLYDLLPTPYGLVRAGVAPDHPKIKAVTKRYDKIAAHPSFRFFGNVELGRDISRDELLERYHVVVYASGTGTDNRLGIPGEDLPGSHAATEFVAWYNGHPAFADREFDLSGRRAVVIGNGNVAVDVARMLVITPQEMRVTDAADHAIEALAASGIEHVVMLGRRGPAQAAFTNPELRELGELTRAGVGVDPGSLELDEISAEWLASAASPTARRNVDILRAFAEQEADAQHTHHVELRFLSSPIAIEGEDRVTGVRVVRNRIVPGADGRLRAVPTGEEEVIECGLVLRSIGYRGEPLPGVPFDERRGLIRNTDGRVIGDGGQALPGEYAVGWIKRGPSGVIGTNKKDAADTVAHVLEDAATGTLADPAREDPEAVPGWLEEKVDGLVTWEGWLAIDAHERALGEAQGRPRVKLVRRQDFDDVVRGPKRR